MKKTLAFIAIAAMLNACSSSKTVKNEPAIYRPAYHYTPDKNWVNDPNGMVYLDGEYHLFYQYNPFGDKWGHMSWGHAVSKDLKTWKELPLAIPETMNADSSTTMAFSGSAVVDSLNTTGFFEKGVKNGIVAIYTSHIDKKGQGLAQHQSLAYSSDKGRTWKFYDKNPVLDIGLKDFRDPSVFWHEGKWRMIVVKPLEYTAQIYESTDLKNWKLLSEYGKIGDYAKIWECPSLFKVSIDNSDKFKWISMISSANEDTDYVGMQYFVGEFDGKTFTPDAQTGVLRIDYGKDFYAAVPFNNLPTNDKNPTIMAWVNNWAYAIDISSEGRRGMFSMPRKLSLVNENGKFHLVQKPVYSDKIHTEVLTLKASELTEAKTFEMKSNSFRLTLTIDLANSKGFSIDLLKNSDEKSVLKYDIASQKLSFDRTKSGKVDFNKTFPSIESMKVSPQNGIMKLDIFVDNSIVEIFANDGRAVLTDLVFPTISGGEISISALK
ncbi:glycoside hydrolase family 32 protein [Emticicia sp. SJ17W-69]|uniref:glycoside hydrolase family 32 protein n=1 Tax=Emticicia sp. SJ17W-69 TaxID=3421657 RepID=UPI003EBB9EB8